MTLLYRQSQIGHARVVGGDMPPALGEEWLRGRGLFRRDEDEVAQRSVVGRIVADDRRVNEDRREGGAVRSVDRPEQA